MPRFRYALEPALGRALLGEGAAGARHSNARLELAASSARLQALERARAEIARGFTTNGAARLAQNCDVALALLERRREELQREQAEDRRELAAAHAALLAARSRRRGLEAHRGRRLAAHLTACERLDQAEFEEAAGSRRGPFRFGFESERA